MDCIVHGVAELDMTQLTFTALHFKHNIFLNEAKNVKLLPCFITLTLRRLWYSHKG